MWGIGPGPSLHWRTVVDDVRVYGSGHSTVLVEMGIVRVVLEEGLTRYAPVVIGPGYGVWVSSLPYRPGTSGIKPRGLLPAIKEWLRWFS